MRLIQRKIISISFRLDENIQPVRKLLAKYGSVPMSLADACLVRMSELDQSSQVFTLDSDFNLYRKDGRRIIPTIMPL
jgi:predicted nucleic acid-binding protein